MYCAFRAKKKRYIIRILTGLSEKAENENGTLRTVVYWIWTSRFKELHWGAAVPG